MPNQNDPQADPDNPYTAARPTEEPIYDARYVGPSPHMMPQSETDATGGLIPYKNPKALIAYYLGIFAFIPVLGIPLGFAALILGILGLRDRARKPVIRGSVHAWIGIIIGGGFALLWSTLIAITIGAAVLA